MRELTQVEAAELYIDIKNALLALRLQPESFLDTGTVEQRRKLQRKITVILAKRKLDPEEVAQIFNETYGAISDRNHYFRFEDDHVVFRGRWQLKHLLQVLAYMLKVCDTELKGQKLVSMPHTSP